MSLQGLDPDRIARIGKLVAECGPLLRPVAADATDAAGMAAVQELLSARQVGVMDSILVTRELLGAGSAALGEAKGIVLCSPSRRTERRIHQELVEGLLDGLRAL